MYCKHCGSLIKEALPEEEEDFSDVSPKAEAYIKKLYEGNITALQALRVLDEMYDEGFDVPVGGYEDFLGSLDYQLTPEDVKNLSPEECYNILSGVFYDKKGKKFAQNVIAELAQKGQNAFDRDDWVEERFRDWGLEKYLDEFETGI